MKKKRYSLEQIIGVLKQAEVSLAHSTACASSAAPVDSSSDVAVHSLPAYVSAPACDDG